MGPFVQEATVRGTTAGPGPEQPTGRVKVRVSGLVKRFASSRGEVTAIDGLSLEVREGEVVSLLGPSGCGKSTLLRILAGLLPPTAGRAEVLDRRGRLPAAMVFQGTSLFPWYTALENAAYPLRVAGAGRRARARTALDALERVGLGDFAGAYPAQLSEGMRQRVALARALVADADVLLMDEPFSALDEPTRLLLQEDLQRILAQTGQTAIVVTHSIDEAVLLGDRVIVLSRRPARSRLELAVPFARPRRYADLRADPRFAELTVAAWEVLRAEVAGEEGGA